MPHVPCNIRIQWKPRWPYDSSVLLPQDGLKSLGPLRFSRGSGQAEVPVFEVLEIPVRSKQEGHTSINFKSFILPTWSCQCHSYIPISPARLGLELSKVLTPTGGLVTQRAALWSSATSKSCHFQILASHTHLGLTLIISFHPCFTPASQHFRYVIKSHEISTVSGSIPFFLFWLFSQVHYF